MGRHSIHPTHQHRTHAANAARLWLALSLGILSAACSPDATSPTDPSASPGAELEDAANKEAATYAVIGDAPYTTLADFSRLIAGINGDPAVSRVVHVGDIKSGSTLCSDSWFSDIASAFTTFADPLVYTPGDNEWTDCHRANNGGFDPLERLARIRQVFFAQPGLTLGGQHLPVEAQDAYPENQQWVASDVVFSALHIVGSNNDLAPWFTDRSSQWPVQTKLGDWRGLLQALQHPAHEGRAPVCRSPGHIAAVCLPLHSPGLLPSC